MPVIEVERLHKRYGDTVAVDDVSFTVEEGEIFGILGAVPPGARDALLGRRLPAHPARRDRHHPLLAGGERRPRRPPLHRPLRAGDDRARARDPLRQSSSASRGSPSASPCPLSRSGSRFAFLLGAAALLALGLVVAAVAPTARIAGVLGAMLFFPMMFFAGLWLPRASMPESLLEISDFTSLGAAVGAIQSSMEGDWPQLLHLVVLVGYAVLFGAAARRLLRWE